MREKLKKILYSGTSDLREQLFRLILIVALIVTALAIVAGLFLQNATANTIPLACLLGVILVALLVTFRYHKTDFAALLFAVVVICWIFPLMFFSSGGVEGGAPVWYVLGLLYIFMMFRGKKLVFFLWLAIAADVGTYIIAYRNPEMLISLGGKTEVYYDSLFAILMVGMAVGLIMWFQIRLYEKERVLTLQQKDEIEQMSKSKDAFFTNMSHEIRTPINTIIGLNEMILRESVTDEVTENALHVKNASKMLLALINDILDFSQIESDRMTIVPVPYRTKELFDEIVDLLQIRIKEKNLDFFVDIDSTLPSVLVGDEVRIKQILINLLTNAAKYTQKGSVTLQAQGEMIEQNMLRLTISVSDTGIGIKKEDLESLYDYFKRIDRARNRKIEGSGLGLAITKQLVSLMDGKLTVDSIYTKGSIFTLILEQPVEDAKPIGKMDYRRKLKQKAGSYYKQTFEAPAARILVVDDNETNLMVVEKLLRATKLRIDKARSGEECLEVMKKRTYHAVLLDSMMPGMNGMETLKAIRFQENDSGQRTPIMVLTADAGAHDEQRYLDIGFDAYLPKPVDGARLEAEILKLLPTELLEYQFQQDAAEAEETAIRKILRRKRKKIQICTDCVSDLSKKYVERYDVKMMYQYIETDQGTFRDTLEIDTDNLARYLAHPGHRALVRSASVEEYEAFYAEALTEAENVIHISMAAHVGDAYQNALQAAQGFDHVHVIDSGHITCGEGLLVLGACRMLENGCHSVEEICQELNFIKGLIQTSFLFPSAEGYTGRGVAAFCRYLDLYPIMHMRQSSLKVSGFEFGKLENATKRYIRRKLRRKDQIDKRVVFIIHTGCTVEQQRAFAEEVLKCVPFEIVIMEKASVSCASSNGIGTFGMAYLSKINGQEYSKTD